MSEEKPDYKILSLGDPYPEELDPERYRANQLAHEGMEAARRLNEEIRSGRTRFSVIGHYGYAALTDLRRVLDEYEKFVRLVSGGEGE